MTLNSILKKPYLITLSSNHRYHFAVLAFTFFGVINVVFLHKTVWFSKQITIHPKKAVKSTRSFNCRTFEDKDKLDELSNRVPKLVASEGALFSHVFQASMRTEGLERLRRRQSFSQVFFQGRIEHLLQWSVVYHQVREAGLISSYNKPKLGREYTVEPPVSVHPKCKDLVVAYKNRTTGGRPPTRKGSGSSTLWKIIYCIQFLSYVMCSSFLLLKFFVYFK